MLGELAPSSSIDVESDAAALKKGFESFAKKRFIVPDPVCLGSCSRRRCGGTSKLKCTWVVDELGYLNHSKSNRVAAAGHAPSLQQSKSQQTIRFIKDNFTERLILQSVTMSVCNRGFFDVGLTLHSRLEQLFPLLQGFESQTIEMKEQT